MLSIHELLENVLKRRASDLILKAGSAPGMRVDGQMKTTDLPKLNAEETRELAYEIICSSSRDMMLQNALQGATGELIDADKRMKELERKQELDLVFTIQGLARVRANIYMVRGTVAAALRIIPLRPYSIEELGLPPILKKMAMEPQGLIIITGPTGCGKTTSLASIIEEINRNKSTNIFTIEDPIEYLYEDKKSMIHQREVGQDTQSFDTALRSVTRQNPDVIAIGELRDRETMDVALTAAEIGHLVLTTLHTTSAAATIDRIVNSYPTHMKKQICQQLADSLLCVTSQRLLLRATGTGRVPAVEVMTLSPTVRKQLEDGETADLYSHIREGAHFGMNTMNQALEKLVLSRQVTYEAAIQYAGNQGELRQMLRKQ